MFTFLYFLVAAALLFAVLRLTCGPCVMGRAETGAQTSAPHLRLPVIGLVWAFLYGWYIALLFGGLFNAVASRAWPAVAGRHLNL